MAHTHTCTHARTRTHTHIHTHTLTYTQTHTHIGQNHLQTHTVTIHRPLTNTHTLIKDCQISDAKKGICSLQHSCCTLQHSLQRSYMRESFHTCERVMSQMNEAYHIWMRHLPYKWVISQVCVCVCVLVRVCVCVCVCVRVCIQTPVHAHVHAVVYLQRERVLYRYTCMLKYVYLSTYYEYTSHVYVYRCTFVHTYIDTGLCIWVKISTYVQYSLTEEIRLDIFGSPFPDGSFERWDSVYSSDNSLQILRTPVKTCLKYTGTPVQTCWKFWQSWLFASPISPVRGIGWLQLVGSLKRLGLFCRISSALLGSFAKETYNFKEPTNCSHPIWVYICVYTKRVYAHVQGNTSLFCYNIKNVRVHIQMSHVVYVHEKSMGIYMYVHIHMGMTIRKGCMRMWRGSNKNVGET